MEDHLISVVVDGVDCEDDDQVDVLIELDEVLLLSDVDGETEIYLEVRAPSSKAAGAAAVDLIEEASAAVRVLGVDLDPLASSGPPRREPTQPPIPS